MRRPGGLGSGGGRRRRTRGWSSGKVDKSSKLKKSKQVIQWSAPTRGGRVAKALCRAARCRLISARHRKKFLIAGVLPVALFGSEHGPWDAKQLSTIIPTSDPIGYLRKQARAQTRTETTHPLTPSHPYTPTPNSSHRIRHTECVTPNASHRIPHTEFLTPNSSHRIPHVVHFTLRTAHNTQYKKHRTYKTSLLFYRMNCRQQDQTPNIHWCVCTQVLKHLLDGGVHTCGSVQWLQSLQI